MSRGRRYTVCALRLAVYLAGIFAVRHPPGPPAAARIALSLDTPVRDLTEPLLAMLLFGIVLELLSGAARWR